MGQYYYFKHLKYGVNQKPIRANFGLPWMKSMEKLDETTQIKIFQQVIKDNGWKKEKICAIGDYGYTITYDPESEELEYSFEPKE
jgi:hypothetical protein